MSIFSPVFWGGFYAEKFKEKFMKNRRFAIVAIVLVAVICLGVAFAALVDNLSVTGDVTVDNVIANQDFNNDVYFDPADGKVTIDRPTVNSNLSSVVTAVIGNDGEDTNDNLDITIPAGVLNFGGQEVVVKAYVKNASDEFDASVVITPDEISQSASDLCDISCKFGSSNTKTIAAEDSEMVTIVIKLKETVTGDEDALSGTFSFKLTSTAVRASGN